MNTIDNYPVIAGLGFSVPDEVWGNDRLEKLVDTTDEWIRTRTGIVTRHIAGKKDTVATIASEAAKKALDSASLNPSDIDVIIVATMTPEMPFPATACFVQDIIGAENAAAFDISAACTGFIYALSVGTSMISTGSAENVLIIGAETLSRVVDWKDRNTCVLFGDGAGAAVLSRDGEGGKEGRSQKSEARSQKSEARSQKSEARSQKSDCRGLIHQTHKLKGRIVDTVIHSNGSKAKLLYMPGGGSRYPASETTLRKRMHYLKMTGKGLYKVATTSMADGVKEVLEKNGLGINDMDLLITHQANLRIILSTAKKLDISPEKAYVNINKYGNTSAATIPIALTEAVEEGRIQKGNTVVLAGFGSGMTWGASLLRF